MKNLTRSLVVAGMLLSGTTTFMYPQISQWFTQVGQNEANETMSHSVEEAGPFIRDEMLEEARAYNATLTTRIGTDSYDYNTLLKTPGSDVMARLRIPKIDLDQPVRHGMGDDALLHGVGHADFTSLPVGGEDTNAVLAAHRGLANTVGFSKLTSVVKGDLVYVEVMGETLTYKVYDTETLLPNAAAENPIEQGRDLLTLLTCTPLGINTHRYVVYAERIDTPRDIVAGAMSSEPGFAWWSLVLGGVFVGSVGYVALSARRDRRHAWTP